MFVSYVNGLPESSIRHIAGAHQHICEIVFGSSKKYYNFPTESEFNCLEIEVSSEIHVKARVILRNGHILYTYELNRETESDSWDTTLRMDELLAAYSSYLMSHGATVKD